MIMQELLDAPTREVEIGRTELMLHNRWNAGYLTRTSRPAPNRKVVLVEVHEKWQRPGEDEQSTDLFGELETIVSNHLDL